MTCPTSRPSSILRLPLPRLLARLPRLWLLDLLRQRLGIGLLLLRALVPPPLSSKSQRLVLLFKPPWRLQPIVERAKARTR